MPLNVNRENKRVLKILATKQENPFRLKTKHAIGVLVVYAEEPTKYYKKSWPSPSGCSRTSSTFRFSKHGKSDFFRPIFCALWHSSWQRRLTLLLKVQLWEAHISFLSSLHCSKGVPCKSEITGTGHLLVTKICCPYYHLLDACTY